MGDVSFAVEGRESRGGVWFGLAKNAREGMAATGQIWFWTVVLLPIDPVRFSVPALTVELPV